MQVISEELTLNQPHAISQGYPATPGSNTIAYGAPPPPAGQTTNSMAIQQSHPSQFPSTSAQSQDTGYPNAKGTLGMIQKGCPSKRVQKTNTRQVNMAVLAPPRKPEYLKGYEQPITFDMEDHPPRVPRPAKTLVHVSV